MIFIISTPLRKFILKASIQIFKWLTHSLLIKYPSIGPLFGFTSFRILNIYICSLFLDFLIHARPWWLYPALCWLICVQIASNCTSFAVHPDFLLLTTHSHTCRCISTATKLNGDNSSFTNTTLDPSHLSIKETISMATGKGNKALFLGQNSNLSFTYNRPTPLVNQRSHIYGNRQKERSTFHWSKQFFGWQQLKALRSIY